MTNEPNERHQRHGRAFFLLVFAAIALRSVALGADSPEARFEEIKRSASSQELYQFLWEMPKGADLHNHLHGGGVVASDWLRVATDPKVVGSKRFYTRLRMSAGDVPFLGRYRTLQDSNYAKLPPAFQADFTALDQLTEAEKKEWLASIILEKQAGGRKMFFDDTFFLRMGDLTRDLNLTTELVVHALQQASAEHVCYIEGMVGASFMIDEKGDPVPEGKAIAAFRERLARPDAVAANVPIRFIASILRFSDKADEQVERAYATCAAYPDLYVGINILGSEQDDRGAPLRFVNVFRKMQRTHPGVGITLHAGEGVQTNNNKHVMESLELGATRIGHGTNLISDPETTVLMRTGKFLVEICLISDELVEYTPDLDQHPFPIYLRMGIPVCLNTDDRGIWDSNMTDEYFEATRRFNLSWDEMERMAEDSVKFSFLPETEKTRVLELYRENLRQFISKNMGDDWQSSLKGIHPSVSGYAKKRLSIVGE